MNVAKLTYDFGTFCVICTLQNVCLFSQFYSFSLSPKDILKAKNVLPIIMYGLSIA